MDIVWVAYALPITPHASLAMLPFSLRREKKPGLGMHQGESTARRRNSTGTHIPKNFLDFMKVVAFIMYTLPMVCRS